MTLWRAISMLNKFIYFHVKYIQCLALAVFMGWMCIVGIVESKEKHTENVSLVKETDMPTAGVISALSCAVDLDNAVSTTELDTDTVAVALKTADYAEELNNLAKNVSSENTEVELNLNTPELVVSDIEHKTMWTTHNLKVRDYPSTDGTVVGSFSVGHNVTVTGTVNDSDWVRVQYNDTEYYVKGTYLTDSDPTPPITEEMAILPYTGNGHLTSQGGRFAGPSGSETYYNLNMSNIVQRLKSYGFEGEYWVREDGCKMFGNYIMVAADFNTRPIGTILQTSLGDGIVCDTGSFVRTNPTGIDIATTW